MREPSSGADCSSFYAIGVTRIQSVVLRRIGGRCHFRSRDKDGGHATRCAIAGNPMLYANFTTISFIKPELLPIEVLHCGNRDFRVFLRKNSGNYYLLFLAVRYKESHRKAMS